MENVSNNAKAAANGANSAANAVANTVEKSIKEMEPLGNMNENVENFKSAVLEMPQFGTKEFMESNTAVIKFSFLILVVIVFIILLKIGTQILSYVYSPSQQCVKLFTGMVDATQGMVYPQDPTQNNAVTIPRSTNASDGIEFSWSVWIYINNLIYLDSKYKHIFFKGNYDPNSTNGLSYPNNAPGLYLSPNTNTLVVMMNTFDQINEEIDVPDIPLNKWVNIITRCTNKTLDVFINGTITRSITFLGVPKQNYGDVFVAMNGGFDGYISNLYYYNYSLGVAAIQNILNKGPNTTMIGSTDGMNMKNNNYLSLRWFLYDSNDGYNP